jgi:hypothetical protein
MLRSKRGAIGARPAARVHMLETPARSEDVRSMLDDVDDETIQRVLETGASVDEIAEAISLVDSDHVETFPTTARAEEVREILLERRRRVASTWTAW